MSLKNKPELLWKYLAFLVIAGLGFNAINADSHSGNRNYENFDAKDVQVKKEIIDGDTLMKIIVEGKHIDLDGFTLNNGKLDDLRVMVINIDDFIGEFPNNENILKQLKKKIIIKED